MKISIQKMSTVPEVTFGDYSGISGPYTHHMFVADYKNGSWNNHRIIPQDTISIHPGLAALHYGQSFFEGMKASRREDSTIILFRPDLNAERASESAHRLSMPTFPQEDFVKAVETLVGIDREWVPKKEMGSLYIRPFMFATDQTLGVKPSETYTFMILMTPALGNYFSKPLNILVEERYSRSGSGGAGYAKAAGNYAAAFMPTKEAQEKGFDQILWTDSATHEYVEESGVMNVIIVKNNTLISPPATETILNGTTTRTLLTIASDLGMKCERRKISLKELIEGIKDGSISEIFGCGTAVILSSFNSITYRTKRYSLPTETPVAILLKDTYEKIKDGEILDTHSWCTFIK